MKLFTYAAVSSIFITALGFADSNSQAKKIKNNPSLSPSEKNQMLMQPGYNMDAGVELRDAFDVGITGSFIYLQPTQDNMTIGFIGTASPTILASIGELTPIDFDFKYKPGFKVGINWALSHDDWGLFADYTWLHSTMTTSATAGDGNVIYPSYGHPLIPGERISFFRSSGLSICLFNMAAKAGFCRSFSLPNILCWKVSYI